MNNLAIKSLFILSIFISVILILTPVFSIFIILTDKNSVPSYNIPSTNWYPSLIVSVFYGVITTFFQALLGIYFACVFFFITWGNRRRIIIGIAILMIPYSIPSSITIILFDFAFDKNGYITNLLYLMSWTNTSLLNFPLGRFFVMTILSIWQYTPFFFIAVLVGFIAVPNGIISHARSDGGRPMQIIFYILLPTAMPSIFAALILRLILMLGKVDISLSYFEKSIIGGAETLPVQIVHSIFSYSSMMPVGVILLLGGILLIPVVIYHFTILSRR